MKILWNPLEPPKSRNHKKKDAHQQNTTRLMESLLSSSNDGLVGDKQISVFFSAVMLHNKLVRHIASNSCVFYERSISSHLSRCASGKHASLYFCNTFQKLGNRAPQQINSDTKQTKRGGKFTYDCSCHEYS